MSQQFCQIHDLSRLVYVKYFYSCLWWQVLRETYLRVEAQACNSLNRIQFLALTKKWYPCIISRYMYDCLDSLGARFQHSSLKYILIYKWEGEEELNKQNIDVRHSWPSIKHRKAQSPTCAELRRHPKAATQPKTSMAYYITNHTST